jgi:hypothetical protein
LAALASLETTLRRPVVAAVDDAVFVVAAVVFFCFKFLDDVASANANGGQTELRRQPVVLQQLLLLPCLHGTRIRKKLQVIRRRRYEVSFIVDRRFVSRPEHVRPDQMFVMIHHFFFELTYN